VNRPGDRLRAFAVRWCCTETMARIVDPLIADLQHEHGAAARTGRVWRGRAIRIAGWIAFVRVCAICMWRDDLAPGNWTTDDRRTLMRAVAYSVALVVLITALFEIPPLSNLRTWGSRGMSVWVLLTLAPQALTITITIGATFGIVYAVGGRAFSRRVAEAVVGLACVASALSFANLGWIMPAANQAFRVAISGRSDLPKGSPGLTLGELRQAIEAEDHALTLAPPLVFGEGARYLKDMRLQYHSRWALSFSPIVFTVLTLSLAAGGFLRRWVLGSAAAATFLGYYVLLHVGRPLVFAGTTPASVSAWAPNATFALVAALLAFRKRRVSRADATPAR
jgi:lipopolysaccharide export system permease LptF/LptG-like protein